VACGIKAAGRLDLGLIVAEEGVPWAGTFTANGAAASCVRHCRSLLGRTTRAVVVNSGNANACTGEAGSRAVTVVSEEVARGVGCLPQEVLVASTGPIGVPFPTELLVGALPRAVGSLSGEVGPFAASILTTDTGTKTAQIDLGGASITGVAKGAGMLAPNMATMLAFIVTDARIPTELLQSIFSDTVARTFNRVVVDGCTSTNDTVLLLAGGAAGPPADADAFAAAVTEVCTSLARQMADDAEGHTKVVTIDITGAADAAEADRAARSLATSLLVKCSFYGSDPYWGRVLSDLGTAGVALDVDAVTIAYAGHVVSRGLSPVPHAAAAVQAAVASPAFALACDLGVGTASAWILTNDLSHAYVDENMGTS